MFGELSQIQVEEVLHKQVIGRIGCHAESMTYIVPISYAYDGKYIYGLSQEGMKIDMMRKNRQICFEVDTMQNMANWESIISWGEFEELTQENERQAALQILHGRILPLISSATAKLSPEWPFVPADINAIKGVVFRVLFKKEDRKIRKQHNTFIHVLGLMIFH